MNPTFVGISVSVTQKQFINEEKPRGISIYEHVFECRDVLEKQTSIFALPIQFFHYVQRLAQHSIKR